MCHYSVCNLIMCPYTQSQTTYSLAPVKLHNIMLTHAHTILPSADPGDYGALNNVCLGPFNNSVRQFSFNVSIVNDNIPEDAEMFNVSLTFDIADQGNRIIVSPNIAMVTIKDNDGKHL